MMATTALRNVTGSHLTATDRRNVAAVLDSPGFELNRPYRVNGRKVYQIDRTDQPGRLQVTVSHWTSANWESRRELRKSRSEFDG